MPEKQDFESRIAALEAQLGSSGQQAEGVGGQGGQDPGLVQAFLQGVLAANALSQAAGGAQQGVGTGEGGGAQPQFLSIFSCTGGGGWNPTRYDSFFWCRSRFMCNPQSISCLC